ncbi:MAG: serine hydroxymethyltransferase [Rhodospirillaceae bacterium]|jgi:glycine hydroxymethyltransferase|nr:serine hydroxymethyltransferase [Rhodospirillaceae bacterium]MBT5778753.1 serine hydroxymethyltransferase [Rhodospirillaceae bacterium]
MSASKPSAGLSAGVRHEDFFSGSLASADPEVKDAISQEVARLQNSIELIASENIVSRAVLEAQGSVMTNKYAEGYPGRRYYGGCEYVDVTERLAISRAKQIFSCGFANVQPHSGSQANQAAYMAVMKPGDKLLGMSLAAGGHLTHGAAPNQSGKWFKAVQYGVRQQDAAIDFDEVASLAKEHKPQVIVCGGSAYPRFIDFARFRQIADSVGAVMIVDMAHFAGLVAAGVHPSPVPHADIVTTTTHKTLRGPRGGMILTNDEALAKKIDSAIFPGLQGGPLEHVIAAKAVAFGEALRPEFRSYGERIVDNANILADTLAANGIDIVSGGTDTHLLLADLRPKKLTGKAAEESLERAGMTCNKNAIPFDPQKPSITSGIRLGSPAATSRGFGAEEFRQVGNWIAEVLDGLAANPDNNELVEARVREQTVALCRNFPIYPDLDY